MEQVTSDEKVFRTSWNNVLKLTPSIKSEIYIKKVNRVYMKILSGTAGFFLTLIMIRNVS